MVQESSSDPVESTPEDNKPLPSPGASGAKTASAGPRLRQVEDRLFRKAKAKDLLEDDSEPVLPRVKLTRRQELAQLFRGNPANAELAMELAELYVSEKRPYEAEKVLAEAAQATDNDPVLCDRLGEVQLLRSNEKLTIARHRAVLDKTPSNKEAVKQLESAHNQLELRVYREKSERHPEDPTLAYELALRLLRVKQFEEAIKALEHAVDNEQVGALAEFRAGEAHHRLKQFPQALKRYRHAVEKARAAGQRECLKQALYFAGYLAAGMRMIPQAKKYFTELHALDPNFKDVGKRMQQLAG